MTPQRRTIPFVRPGWTLLEMMAVVSALAILFAAFGPVSVQLLGALRDDPRRVHEQRMAAELLERIGREVRCADRLPVRTDEFTRDGATLLIERDGQVRGYRMTDRGVVVMTFVDGKLVSADPRPLPLSGRFEYGLRGGAVEAVTVRWELKSRGSPKPRRLGATFAPRNGGGQP